MTKSGGVERQRISLSQMKVLILSDVNALLAAIELDAGVPGIHVDIFSKDCFMQLNGPFLNSGVHEMLKGKDYRAVNTVFSISGEYINRTTDFGNEANMTGVRRM